MGVRMLDKDSQALQPTGNLGVPLGPTNLLRFLLEEGLIHPRLLVDDDVVVQATHRRQTNYQIICSGTPLYFVKIDSGRGGVSTTAREYANYKMLTSHKIEPSLREALPKCYGFYAAQNMVVLEAITGSADLRMHHLRLGRFPKSIAIQLAKLLAALHKAEHSEIYLADHRPLTFEPSWPLAIHRPVPSVLYQSSNAILEALALIQSDSELTASLESLKQDWQALCFIHNDIRWDNVLISSTGKGSKRRLSLIDWELAGMGDPAWDIAGVFNAYLSCWILSMPVTGALTPEQFIPLARYPLNSMQPTIRAFWDSYTRSVGLVPLDTERLLWRAVRFAAARLLQTTYESLQTEAQLNGNAIAMIQLSQSILQRPTEAIVQLLGIPLGQRRDAYN